MTNTPEYPPVKALCEEISGASFRVKMRGYAPEEVDAFMDEIMERLRGMDEQLEELRKYETWLRVEVHNQVVERAQQEARQIMQEAQNKSRVLIESARADMVKEREDLHRSIRQYTAGWNVQKEALEQELGELRRYVKNYRIQSARVLEASLNGLRQEHQRDEADAARHTLPSLPTGSGDAAEDPMEEIDRILAEIKRQVK